MYEPSCECECPVILWRSWCGQTSEGIGGECFVHEHSHDLSKFFLAFTFGSEKHRVRLYLFCTVLDDGVDVSLRKIIGCRETVSSNLDLSQPQISDNAYCFIRCSALLPNLPLILYPNIMPAPISAIRITQSTRRSALSSLFFLTFVGAVFTVSASSILPCPAHPNGTRPRLDDGDIESRSNSSGVVPAVRRSRRRWIEETAPGQ